MTTWPVWLLGMLVAASLFGCTADQSNDVDSSRAEEPAQAGGAPTPHAAAEPLSHVATEAPPPPTATQPPTEAPEAATDLLRLVDFLDDPLGYCVDVPGFGANLRLDAPLQAHTCKPGSDDQLFAQIDGGGMRLTRHDRCLTADNPAHGSAVRVATCEAGEASQGFRLDAEGRLRLRTDDGSTLCLGVAGGSGEPAGGRNHLRRDLVLYDCDEADPSLAIWELVYLQI